MANSCNKPVHFHHPTFGHLTGVQTAHGPVQFRNLPYSEIPSRWKHSTTLTSISSDAAHPYDATEWGPAPPQAKNSIDFDFGLIQKRLPLDRKLDQSETDCLNLVVTTPSLSATGLPVMVFIHGGGFFVGCNAWPQYDLYRFIKHSADLGKPVIGVCINYRLGILGFLASTELEDSTNAGNYGLTDQVSALKWVQQHIAGFGGNPSNVTVFGESAGSISTHLHLLRGEPLFQRAICMSGNPQLRQPQPVQVNEDTLFRPLAKSLDLSNLSVGERIAKMKKVPWETLVNSEFNVRVFPSISNGFVALESDLRDYQEQVVKHFSWCNSLMIGDCAQDASAFFRRPLKSDWFGDFIASAREFLGQGEVELLCKTYKLQASGVANGEIETGILQFTSDARFYLPLVLASMATLDKADLRTYHLLEGNPFDGPFKGMATHVLDIVLIFQNYEDYLPPDTTALGRHMAEKFIDFAHGVLDKKGNLDSHQDRHTTVWGPMGQVRHMPEKEYDLVERENASELINRLGVGKCIAILELFQFGRRS